MPKNSPVTGPLVTVVMPVYNARPHVGAAIQSVLDQTYRPIQLLIGDDASTDGTQAIVESFAARYPDIVEAFFHPGNLGLAGNVDSLYPHIRGRYVSWFAGDDLFYPDKIASQIGTLQDDPACVFCYHDVDVIDEEGRFLFRYNDKAIGQKAWTEDVAANLMRHRCFISGLSVTLDRERSGGVMHRFECGPCADWLMFFELAAIGKAAYIDRPLGAYRRHPGNITRKAEAAWEDVVYDFVAMHYTAYRTDIEKGRLLLYLKYIFKYGLRRQWKDCRAAAGTFLGLLAARPSNLFFALQMLFTEIQKRIMFHSKTGRLSS